MYELFQSDKTGKFHFRLKAGNGEIILSSQAYGDKASCLKGIESVRKNAADEASFESKVAVNGKPYFVLKAGNGQVIGQSQQYKAEDGLENGIASVVKNAAGEVRDLAG